MEDNIGRIRNELEEARQSLHQTVAEVYQKVEKLSAQLNPGHLAVRHLRLAACIAGVLGFAAGSSVRKPAVAALVVGGLFGALLTEASGFGFGNYDTTA